MGRIKKGITGGFIGKVGPIQGKVINGRNVVTKAKGQVLDKERIVTQPQNINFSLGSSLFEIYGTLIEESMILGGLEIYDLRNRFLSGAVNTLIEIDSGPVYALEIPGGKQFVIEPSKLLNNPNYKRFEIQYRNNAKVYEQGYELYLKGGSRTQNTNKSRTYNTRLNTISNRIINSNFCEVGAGPVVLLGQIYDTNLKFLNGVWVIMGTF